MNNNKNNNKNNNNKLKNIKLFHNWIKDKLIKESVNFLKNIYNFSDIQLLDLAVGKGDDMIIWLNNNIYSAVGIDIDKESIQGDGGAIDQYNQLVHKLEDENKIIPKYEFYVYNLADPGTVISLDYLFKERKFHIISCQFSIQYFFKNITSLETLITIVSKFLYTNGLFIGTTINGNKILQMFMHNDIINRKFYILENRINLSESYNPLGNKYLIKIKGQNKEEYLVNKMELIRVCEEHKLWTIGIIYFKKWYKKYKHFLNEDEKEFSFLHYLFIFIKKNKKRII